VSVKSFLSFCSALLSILGRRLSLRFRGGRYKSMKRTQARPRRGAEAPKTAWLARGEDGALGGGVAGHGRDFLEVDAGYKHGRWSDTAPAIQLRLGTEEFHLRAKREVENDFGAAAIKLLRKLQERLFAEVLPVGRTPDGDVERLLFDLFSDSEYAEERARTAGGNVEGFAVGVGKEFGFRGNQ
jgi:hypothetical protein